MLTSLPSPPIEEYNHIKHMEHHPYAKPMFSWMRMSSKTKALPWK